MLYIKAEEKTVEITVEGTGQELTEEIFNVMKGMVQNFDAQGGEEAGTAFAATIMAALDQAWSERPGYASMKETAEKIVRVAKSGKIVGVKA